MQIDFEVLFAQHVAATQKEWAHDRSETVGASEIFGCLRKAFFLKRGKEFTNSIQTGVELVESGTETIDGEEFQLYEEQATFSLVPMYPEDEDDEDSWGAAKRGDILEMNYVVPAMRDYLSKGKLIWSGPDQRTLIDGRNSATPDGLFIGQDRDALALYGIPDIGTHCFGLEIKSIDPRVRLDEEKAIHHGQTIQQMGLIRAKTPYKPEYTVIIYVDASFLDKIHIFPVKYDEEPWEAAKLRAHAVFETNDPALLPPEGKLDGECKFCKFTRSCGIVTNGSIPDDNSKLSQADEELLSEFDVLTAEWKEKKTVAEETAKEFEEMKEKVKDALKLAGTRKIGGKKAKRDWSISWSSRDGARRVSNKLMEEAGIDLEPYRTEGTPYDVLLVKFSGEKE